MTMRLITITCLIFSLFVNSLSANEVKSKFTTVDVYHAEVSDTKQILSLTGTVEAKQHADLAVLQQGLVAQYFVEAGDTVSQGQKLLTLDTKLAELSLAQVKAQKAAAEAEKAEAQRLYSEVITLSKKQLVAETLLGERLSALAIADAELGRVNAELAEKKEMLARHTLYAPFAGVIAQRHIDLGEWVTQQTPVFTLVEQQNMRLNIAIPQEYFAQLNGQQNVTVKVTPDFAGATAIEARLNRLVGVANNSSRTIIGLVELPENAPLVSGMSARADLRLPASSQPLLWLPKSALKQHPDGGTSVFIVENNQAKRKLVKVVNRQGNLVSVSGADANKPFVISGIELLQHGDAVKVNLVKGQLK
ncbi:efflux RND transporter periplasmic adaptor subunit [Thalassotalea sp. PLHSN55]|uniref:efflux RND transporter periplasmic adaptor subunit n=1 Tax=Thalassotalea sp. PLHSN55 TaxID=3435888 RepID=UPI003F858628